MKLLILLAFTLAPIIFMTISADAQTAKSPKPVMIMETSLGTMEITLNQEKAPITVKNFLSYVNEGYYDGTLFHRVINGFMIQGGGYTKDMLEKPTKSAIKNEAGNGLSNKRGTIAMARTNRVNSATSQFFINLKDNSFLDHKSDKEEEFGYAVFGEVTKGIEVIDRIAEVKTNAQDAPIRPVVIRSVKVKL